jgi:hypothetical protein
MYVLLYAPTRSIKFLPIKYYVLFKIITKSIKYLLPII